MEKDHACNFRSLGRGAATPPATFLARLRKYVLTGGGLCFAAGAIEGGIIGSILAPQNDPGTLILKLALDRGILLGLGGAVFGSGIAVLEWLLRSRKKQRT